MGVSYFFKQQVVQDFSFQQGLIFLQNGNMNWSLFFVCFFNLLFNFVKSPEGPLDNTIMFTTGLEMLFTIFTVTRKTNTILHITKLGFEQLAPALHT